jgi:2-dehydro-3-deoxygluconokinase
MIYFSGITLAILSVRGREALLAAAQKARAAGKTIAFDPNLRPRLWTSDKEMTDTIMQAAAVSDIVLPSFEDEAGWFGDADPKATADRYLNKGVATVVVKNGADPVLFTEEAHYSEVPVTAVEMLVDTTAAGDSFNAGIFACYAAGKSLADSVAYACALSRNVVQSRGALVPFDPDRIR